MSLINEQSAYNINKRFKNISKAIIANTVVWIISIIVLIPMMVIVVNAFKTRGEAYTMTLTLPKVIQFSNLSIVIEQGKLVTSFINSLLYATTSTLIIVILVSLASFALSRRRTKINRVIYYLILLGIAMPINNVVLMQVLKVLHIINTRGGIILVYAALNIPISLFLSYGYINNIPKDLDEAAVIDGCGPVSLFVKVILPLLKPIMATIFVLNFMGVWNDFTMPLYFLSQSSKWPMTLAVYNFFGMYQQQWNLVSADILLTTLPVLIVFILGQKYIIGGMTAGAIKG